MIYVKQHLLSPLSLVEIKNYVQDIGNQRFSSPEGLTNSGLLKYKEKASFSKLLLPCHLTTLSPIFFVPVLSLTQAEFLTFTNHHSFI